MVSMQEVDSRKPGRFPGWKSIWIVQQSNIYSEVYILLHIVSGHQVVISTAMSGAEGAGWWEQVLAAWRAVGATVHLYS